MDLQKNNNNISIKVNNLIFDKFFMLMDDK